MSVNDSRLGIDEELMSRVTTALGCDEEKIVSVQTRPDMVAVVEMDELPERDDMPVTTWVVDIEQPVTLHYDAHGGNSDLSSAQIDECISEIQYERERGGL